MNQHSPQEEAELLSQARSAGFDIIDDESLTVRPEAVRLLPSDANAIAYDLAGDVLAVISPVIPTPADFRLLEKSSGMPIMLSIAPPRVYDKVRERVQASADGAGVPLSIGPVLEHAVKVGASDVHLSVGQHPIIRLHGILKPLENTIPLSASDLEAAARWVAGSAMDNFTGDFDCAISYAASRWRVSVYKQRQSLALAVRRIPSDIPRMEDLGLPESVRRLVGLSQGLVLFCGPTGSGKSTSLAALVDRINRTRSCHILTIEDPIEYAHTSRTATVHQREVGEDTASFASGLRSALRQDPDVILVGELRDLETMQMALSAAETGHLVFATVHAATTDEAFTRIITPFPAVQQDQVRTQLAASIKAIVAQQLLPSTDGKRTLVAEVLVATNAVKNIVRDNRLHEIPSVLDTERREGMRSLDYALAELVAAGRLSEETAEMWARDKESYAGHLRAMPRTMPTGFAGLDDLDEFGKI